jgi:hypothetical protein
VHSRWIVYWPAVELPLLVTLCLHLTVEMVCWRECRNAPRLPLPIPVSFLHCVHLMLVNVCKFSLSSLPKGGVEQGVACLQRCVLWLRRSYRVPESWQLDISHAVRRNSGSRLLNPV